MARVVSKKKFSVSKKIPLHERRDTDVKCASPTCNNFAKEGSEFCCVVCGRNVTQYRNRQMKRALGIPVNDKFPKEPEKVVEPWEIRSKRLYIKYGVDPAIREKFKKELGIA